MRTYTEYSKPIWVEYHDPVYGHYCGDAVGVLEQTSEDGTYTVLYYLVIKGHMVHPRLIFAGNVFTLKGEYYGEVGRNS